MSQSVRRAFAAAGLALALLLTLPAPSRAAGPWEEPAARLAARVWSWLESLGIVAPQPASPFRQPAARWEKEGSAINPDGRAARVTCTTPPGTDPDGTE
ncbi:MAG TPA: hypothetical protein VGG03_21980 [Thermoanaerobaculia bacterium]